ncbi:hypothetical protein CLV92_101180 [Kineococcus xinjiangensis]|uniref:Tetratricopeptide repeat protein n=1 Tax=Kineococcus xinjiangensis TaxID=512762 RepID=A0A2S6IW17_9ACTN|nr:hypothetical protein [Kineococcus xinjiangensis]PPK98485.1 hypothetical protein CLV92_101180 [Kineococcus xinjiangensis]
MRTKLLVAGGVLVIAFYGVTLGRVGVELIREGGLVAVAYGLALLVLPLVAAWAVARELSFGAATERLGRELAARGELPADELERTPGGRIDRAAGRAMFEVHRAEVERRPDDAGAWYRLALAYDAAGDRRRGRAAARHAVRLHRSGPADPGPTPAA